MSYQLFNEKLKTKLLKARSDQVEELALGYGKEDYENRVGIIRGYDDAINLAQQVMKELLDGE